VGNVRCLVRVGLLLLLGTSRLATKAVTAWRSAPVSRRSTRRQASSARWPSDGTAHRGRLLINGVAEA
jgi:hypothetical protein